MKIKVFTCALSLMACVLSAASAPLSPSADDYTAITTAIAAAPDSGEVLLGPGTFTLTNQISISRAVTLRGTSRDGTVVDCVNKCRAFYLSYAGATVADLTIYRGKGGNGGGVYMTKGLVTNCWIKSCYMDGSHYQKGGGVYMENGTVADCEFSGCTFGGGWLDEGLALYQNGGTVTRCDFHDNNGGGSGRDGYDLGYRSQAVCVKSGTFSLSRVHDNTVYLAGLRQAGGTVVNCLIYRNRTYPVTGTNLGAGVYKTNGTMLYCTIYGNYCPFDETGCSGIAQKAGTTRYCISVGNGPQEYGLGSNAITGGTFENNVIDKALALYGTNRTGDPDFAAPDANDFQIVHTTSPAYGYGLLDSSATKDFNGATRSLTAPTAGAYENPGHTLVPIPAPPFVYANGTKQVASVAETADMSVLQNAGGTSAGSYPVVVALKSGTSTWTDGSTTNKTVQFEILEQTVIQPSDGYEKIAAAIASVRDGETILFANGTCTVTNTITLSRPITLKGESRDGAILDFEAKRRGFILSGANACLRDLTISRGASTAQSQYGGGIYLTDGMVTNCLITNCTVSAMYSNGGGIHMAGGKVLDCEITRCTVGNLYDHGNAISIFAGVASRCDIHHNDGGYSHSGLYGDAIVYMANGLFEKSKVHHNTKSALPGVYLTGGILRNCLIYGNSGDSNGAGVYQTGGTLEYTTVHGNVIKGDTSGISGICRSGGTTRFSIFYGNGPEGGSAGSCKVSGSTPFVTNVIDKALASYPDNRASDPMFVGVSSNDYRISSRASSAYGYAWPVPTVIDDIVDFARDATAPTCGAYEYNKLIEKFEANIKIVQSDYLVGSTATVEAVVSGAELDEVTLLWYLDGTLLAGKTSAILELEGLSLGHHTVKLAATRTADGKKAEKEVVDALTIRPLTCYVSWSGTGTYPYDTPAKATNSIAAAFAAVWSDLSHTSVVHIASGIYTNTATVTVLDQIRILGEDRDSTIVVNKSARAFSLANAVSELCDLTVRDSYAGISVSAGIVHDFKIKSCYYYDNYGSSAGLNVSGTGSAWNGLIEDCSLAGIYGGGGGLNLSGGIVSNVVIRRCTGSTHLTSGKGGAVYMAGGTLTHAVIDSSVQTSAQGVGIYATGGTLEHCAVTNNTLTSCGYAVCLTVLAGVPTAVGVTARNCLFALNSQPDASWPAVVLTGGTYENCTFATNVSPHVTLKATNVTAVNTIFEETGGENDLSGTFTFCCASSLSGDGNVSDDPRFRRRGPPWHLNSFSPALNAGRFLEWMTPDATDLDGSPRVQDACPDIGCYETRRVGFLILGR